MENNILFRCSQLGHLVSEPKLKVDKEAGNLSESAKTYIESIWLEKNYGYKESFETFETKKGILVESETMSLVYDVLGGELRFKNRDNFKNDFICGTPDTILTDCVEDIKSSFTVKTYFNSEMTTIYEWQLRGYMWLTGKKKARLIYGLVDTPEEIKDDLKRMATYKSNTEELFEIIEKNHTFDDIKKSDRVKHFDIQHSDEKIEFLKAKIIKAREYYSQLKLK